MKIIVDGFGGDNAPLAVLQGCEMGIKLYDVDIIITGDEQKLKTVAQENNINLDRIEIVHTPAVIEVKDNPMRIIKDKKDSSMGVALTLLSEGKGDAALSAGSTAALVVGASTIVKRIKGVKRAALASIIPSISGCYMLLDVGANLDVKPEVMTQFGVMGSVYMNKVLNVDNPKVGIVNIGTEDCKGTELQIETYELLKQAPLNFIGNIEAREMPLDGADVVVADGFTGNVILKHTEGMGKMFALMIKSIFGKGIFSKLAAVMVLGGIKNLKKKMDYTEYGGAPLMGTKKPVIKAHGSSNAKAFSSAIKQAKFYAENNVIKTIEDNISK